jgi:DNA-binding transcriptional MerR regulator
MNSRQFTVKELADQAGVSTSAIRAWERRFSIFLPLRTAGGHRLYGIDDLKLLLFVKHLQSQKRDLKEISHLGRSSLLEQARAFFATNEIHSPCEPPSTVSHILNAANSLDLPKIAKLVDHLRAVSVSPIDFAETILCIMTQLVQSVPAVPDFSTKFLTDRAQSHLIAALLPLRSSASAASALCARMGDSDSINLLRTAHYLRSWGYQPLFIQHKLNTSSLHSVVINRNTPLICISIDGSVADNAENISILAREIAPHALVCLISDNGKKLEPCIQEMPESKLIYFVESILEFEILAEMWLKNERSPTQMLQAFRADWHSS